MGLCVLVLLWIVCWFASDNCEVLDCAAFVVIWRGVCFLLFATTGGVGTCQFLGAVVFCGRWEGCQYLRAGTVGITHGR